MKSKLLFLLLLIAGFAQAAPQDVASKTIAVKSAFSFQNLNAVLCYSLVGVLLIGTLLLAAKVKAYSRQVENEKLNTSRIHN